MATISVTQSEVKPGEWQALAVVNNGSENTGSGVRATMAAGTRKLTVPANCTKCVMTAANSGTTGDTCTVEAWGYPKKTGDGALLKTNEFAALATIDTNSDNLALPSTFNLLGCSIVDFLVTAISAGNVAVRVMFF